jgi:sulfite exporter TauE/SafE
MPGVKKIDIDYATEEVQVIYDPHKIKYLNIKEAIESKSYICDDYKENKKLSTSGWILTVLGIIVVAYFTLQYLETIELPQISANMSYGMLFIVGLLIGLMIACGPLQAIYIMAAGTGSMIEGAKLLFVFALGTLPVMLSFGYVTSFIGAKATREILKFSGAVVIILGIFMINNGLALTGAG